MSLTSFLRIKDVKERFRQQFVMPKFAVSKDLLAPPQSTHYTLVGTAFDYLMRFYLERLNPNAVTSHWVAEHSITHPLSPLLEDVVISAQTGEVISYTETELAKMARRIIDQAKIDYREHLSSGHITDQLIESALRLAQLDPVYRAGFIDENLGTVHEEDVADLRNLISIVPPEPFKAAHLCLLNPAFGEASALVGGADADLVIDNAIVDIKTTKKLQLQRSHFDQLVGYVVLHEIAGVGELTPRPEISKIGIYFSRHAYLHTIDVQSVIQADTFLHFVDWFKQRASAEYGGPS
jgi:hypothetical protein